MIQQLTESWVCWAIVLLALYTYRQLWLDYLQLSESADNEDNDAPERDHNRKGSAILIGALPLLGLFGTITGLQQSFTGMMLQGADSQMVTGGIAQALITTQLGLVLAIPGWLLFTFVNAKSKRIARK